MFLCFFLPSEVDPNSKNDTFLKALFFKGFRSPFFPPVSVSRPREAKKFDTLPFGRRSPEDALLDVGTLESFDVYLELSPTTTHRGVGRRSEVHGTLERKATCRHGLCEGAKGGVTKARR